MIYIVVFMSSVFFAWLAERSKDKGVIVLCSVISILIPSILGGLRAYGVGTDTIIYGRPIATAALNSPSLAYFMATSRTEPSYNILTFFIMKTLGHENWCYFFYQLITISCVYIGCWKHRKIASVSFSMFIFLMMNNLMTYNIMRQGMAAAIIFMGLYKLEERHYGYFLLYVFIAITFHNSVLIAFFLILGMFFLTTSPILDKYNYLKIIIISGFLVFLIFARPIMFVISSNISLMSRYLSYFNSTNHWNVSNTSASIIGILAGEFLLFIFFYKGANQTLKKIGFNVVNFYIYNIIFIILYEIIIKLHSERVLIYSIFANIIALSSAPNFIREKNLRLLTYISIGIVSIIYLFNIYFVLRINEAWPYRSILD